jgi:Fic family protein
MAHLLKLRWDPTFVDGLPRRDRHGCEYEAYLPDRISNRTFLLDGDVTADVTDAESAIQLLNSEAIALTGLEGLARLLLRAEAVASSKIEGFEIGGRRLLHAEVARTLGDDPPRDVTAEEILGNIDAMAWAVSTVGNAEKLEVGHLYEIHRRLVAGTRLAAQGGVIRDRQNWIGGSDYNPCEAQFVPPPHEELPRLLGDLCTFCNEDQLPAVAQAAIAHSQFETIHPFSDGNGRTGRALIHVVLRRRGLIPRVLPPISLVLATWARDYVTRLMGTRYVGGQDSPAARKGLNRWIGLFATAASRAVTDARMYEERVAELQSRWRQRLGRVRKGSAVDLFLDALPGAPVITVKSAAEIIGRSFVAANSAVHELVEAQVLSQVRLGRRNRAFEATEVIEMFNDLERQLASPVGDTHTSPPSRAVPARRTTQRSHG